jgi:hypothetical protein
MSDVSCPLGASDVLESTAASVGTQVVVAGASVIRVEGRDMDEVVTIRQRRVTCQQENHIHMTTKQFRVD